MTARAINRLTEQLQASERARDTQAQTIDRYRREVANYQRTCGQLRAEVEQLKNELAITRDGHERDNERAAFERAAE